MSCVVSFSLTTLGFNTFFHVLVQLPYQHRQSSPHILVNLALSTKFVLPLSLTTNIHILKTKGNTMFSFVTEKAKSRNYNWFLAIILTAILVTVGEAVGTFTTRTLALPLSPSPRLNLLLQLFSFLFITLTVILWAKKVEKASWEAIRFVRKHALRDFLLGWLFGGLFLTDCVLVMALLGGVQITGFNFSLPLLLQFLPLTLAWSIQGHAEEVLTRGWLFGSVAARYSIPIGVLVSSLTFALLHAGNDGLSIIPLLDLVLFGVLAALYYLKSGSIWGISGAHAAWNCFQGNFFGFRVSGTDVGTAFIDVKQTGPEWLNGGAFGVEGSLVSVIAQILIILWLTYDLFYKKRNA